METIYLGHDNSIDRILKADDVAVSLAAVTDMSITIGGVTVNSDNGVADPIRWVKAGYATGEYRLFLGGEAFVARETPYWASLVVYDAANPDGIVWDVFEVKVVSDMEVVVVP